MTERQNTYLARNLTLTGKIQLEDEAIVDQSRFYTLSEMHEMIEQGKINDGQSLTGLYLVEQWLNRQEDNSNQGSGVLPIES